MRVKRFVGESVAETMGKVKKELGSDAVILQTRQFKEGGVFGLFGKTKVEITAAIEERPVTKPLPAAPSLNAYASARKYAQELDRDDHLQKPLNAGGGISNNTAWAPGPQKAEEPGNRGMGSVAAALAEDFERSLDTSAMQRDLRQMQKLLSEMNKQMGTLGRENSIWPAPLQAWAEGLRERGISEALVKRLLRQVQQVLPEEKWPDRQLVWENLKESTRRICDQTAAIQPGVQKPRVVALIGPTGVGKTTTIGKLAAGFSIVDKRKVALITADTYRVAAVEQLKTFGEIIGVPVEVVMTPAGLREALARHSDKELIFIDTAGRSPQHELHMSELRAFLDRAEPDLTILVMSATTQTMDQLRVFQRFETLATHLIFTKLDETVSGGSLLNVLDQTTLPVAYLTTGQNVPDDIEVATPERLARHILGEGNAYA